MDYHTTQTTYSRRREERVFLPSQHDADFPYGNR